MTCESRDEPTLTLITQIKDRTLDPKTLSADDRQRCVEVLRAEGYGAPEIAQVLRRHERTIYRDLDEIRARRAFDPDPLFAAKMTGELIRQTEISVTRLRRIARESSASAMERLLAEGAAWKVFRESIQTLQSLGHLPRVPATVVADVFQHGGADAVATYDELAQRILNIERVDSETGMDDPRRVTRLRQLQEEIHRGRVAAQIDGLETPPQR